MSVKHMLSEAPEIGAIVEVTHVRKTKKGKDSWVTEIVEVVGYIVEKDRFLVKWKIPGVHKFQTLAWGNSPLSCFYRNSINPGQTPKKPLVERILRGKRKTLVKLEKHANKIKHEILELELNYDS